MMTDRFIAANQLGIKKTGLLALALLFSTAAILQVPQGSKKAAPAVINTVIDPQDTFPVPAVPNQLFYLQRTSNTNTIVYEAKLNSKGMLEEPDPVHVFWIRYPEGGMKKELNYIQRMFAYGIKTQLQPNSNYKMHVVSYKKQQLTLMRSPKDNKYHVYTQINHKEAVLRRIFVKIGEGGTFWAPNVLYMELRGKDEVTGEELMERIKP